MSPVTIYDVSGFDDRSGRELPGVIAGALRLMWAAGPRGLASAYA